MDYKSVVSNIDFDAYEKAMRDVIDDLEKMHESWSNLGNNTAISITSRLKDKNSIISKMIKKKISDCNDPSTFIHDVAGVRCIFSCDVHKDDVGILERYIDKKVNDLKEESDIEEFLNRISEELIAIFEYYGKPEFKQNCDIFSIYKFLVYFGDNSNYKILNEKNFIENPKKSGYRGYHIVVRTENGVDVEIQFRTFLQHIWSQLEHKFIYKCKSLGITDVPEKFKDFFIYAASTIDEMSRTYVDEHLSVGVHFGKH